MNITNQGSDNLHSEPCFLKEFSAAGQYEYYKITSITTVCLNTASALWVAVGNLSILVAVARIKQLQLPSTLLLVSLIFNDFLVGTVLQPLAIGRSVQWLIADKFCKKMTIDIARMFFIYFCRCNSLMNLLCLSIERLIGISCTVQQYKAIVSKKRVVIAISAVWAFNLMLTVIVQFFISESAKNTMKSVPFGIMGAGIIGVQIGILRAYRRNNRIESSDYTNEERNALRSRVKFEKKAAVTLAWILTAFLISYLPIIVIFLIRAANGRNYLRLTTQWLEVVLYLNSACNPIIYFHRHTNLRNEVKNFLCAQLCSTQVYQTNQSAENGGAPQVN